MAVQVGDSCYATPAEAAVAACASYVPASAVTGSSLTSVSCITGVDDGSIKLQIARTDLGTNNTTYAEVVQLPTYPPCIEGQKVEASLAIFGATLAMLAVCIGPFLLYRMFMANPRVTE